MPLDSKFSFPERNKICNTQKIYILSMDLVPETWSIKTISKRLDKAHDELAIMV